MLSCGFDRIKDADFITITFGSSSFSESNVYSIEVVIGGFPYELCDKGFPVEFDNYGQAVQSLRGHFGKLSPPTHTIFCFGENTVNCDFVSSSTSTNLLKD